MPVSKTPDRVTAISWLALPAALVPGLAVGAELQVGAQTQGPKNAAWGPGDYQRGGLYGRVPAGC